MARCENCNMSVSADMMMVGVRGTEKILVGPCCADSSHMAPKINYHFEFSSRNGLVARAEYAGLRIEFQKPAVEVEQFVSKYTNPKEVEGQHVTH